jgi:hypothetical protein
MDKKKVGAVKREYSTAEKALMGEIVAIEPLRGVTPEPTVAPKAGKARGEKSANNLLTQGLKRDDTR